MKAENASENLGSSHVAKDRKAEFEKSLEAARGPLLRFVFSLIGNFQDAEDIIQRASVTMWRRFSEFEEGTNFLAWSFAFASFEAKNFVRSISRSVVMFDDGLMDKLAIDRGTDLQKNDARMAALDECIQHLDAESKALIESVYTRGEEIKEIARKEGRAPQTFYNRLNVIRRQLTECMRSKIDVSK